MDDLPEELPQDRPDWGVFATDEASAVPAIDALAARSGSRARAPRS